MWNFVNLIDSVITVPAEAPKAVVIRFVAFSMDLNKASQKQIMEVQLVGEVLSKRIVKHRPFSSWAEVKTLAQIGDKRLQKLKAVFTIEMAKAPPDDEQSRTDEEFKLVEKLKSADELLHVDGKFKCTTKNTRAEPESCEFER